MRQATQNGIMIKYPDTIGFAFMPCVINVQGSGIASMDVVLTSEKGKTATYQLEAFNNKCVMDYREYVQGFFDGLDFGIDYTKEAEKSNLGIVVSVSVKVKNSSGSSIATLDYKTFYVWGAMRANETWSGWKKLTWFRNFPFSFNLFAADSTNILIGRNNIPHKYIETPSQGIYNIMAGNISKDAKYSIIYNYDGEIKQATFDNTFDLTFYLGSGKQSELMRIEFDDTEDGVYLRWVDRHGFYRYWLFTAGDEERAISSDTSYIRNNLGEYDDTCGYLGTNGRRQSYEREDTISVCAPLVDRDTFDFLQDLASSPIVDMYLGNNKWQSVTIKAGTYTKTTAVLQDFTCNVVLNNTNIQQL